MDFDLDSFFDVENVINAIFNGVPQITDYKGPPKPLLTRRPQPSLGASVTLTFPSTSTASSIPSSAPIYSPGRTGGSEYHQPSLPAQTSNDADKNACSENALCHPPPPLPFLPELGDTPSVYVDSSKTVLLAPDLDMSSAIALSKTIKSKRKRSHHIAFGNEDRPVTPPRHITFVEATQLPEKSLRDELVKLYFIYFHPFCPVVNEVEFMEVYRDIEDDEELKQRIPIPLFQAMMNVAFGHLPSERLSSTPFITIYDGQRAYFEKASLLYRMRYTQDHLILTKIALLLSYWSPFDSEHQVNNYWIDRAFSHARVIRLWDRPGENVVTSSRYRLIWWCCLLRDRLTSIALRRPYRIRETKRTWPLVTEADFGLEVMFPRFTTIRTKKILIQSFIWLCKLSDTMRDIAVFHEQTRFDREWSNNCVDQAKIMSEASQVSQFDSLLRSWRGEYLKMNGEYIASLRVGTSKFSNYVLVICDSAFATLYRPYIYCPPGSSTMAQKFQKFALRRIKETSCATALHCSKISQALKVGEEFPIGIYSIAWIALPMTVFKILKEKGRSVSGEINGRRYEDFIPFLSSFATRFRPAMLLGDIMGESINEIVERSTKLGIIHRDVQHRLHDAYQRAFDITVGSMNAADGALSGDEDEAEILNCVAKMVDLRFSTDGST